MVVRVDAADTPGLLYHSKVSEGRLRKIAEINADVGSRRLSPVKLVR